MVSYIPNSLQTGLGGIQLLLAANYESRVQTLSKFNTPRAQYAGDTAVTLTDGSYNVRAATTSADIPVSATAELASTTNITDSSGATSPNVTAKPLIIKMMKNEFTGEVGVQEAADPTQPVSAGNPIVTKTYAVFNADGTWPGGVNPWNYLANTGARYRVNDATGEIYVNNAQDFIEFRNGDNTLINFNVAGYDSGAGATTQQVIATGVKGNLEGKDKVVGIVDFEALQGGASSALQQQAADLTSAIQSLTSILRATNDTRKEILGIIK